MPNRRKHVSPIYAVVLLWLGWTFMLPLWALLDYLPLITLAIILYNVVNSLRKKQDKVETTTTPVTVVPEQKAEKKSTGNPAIDKLISQRDEAVSEMRRLNVNIENEKITDQINDMEYTTTKIFDYVIAHPDKSGQITKFLNYYLPTTIKLLNTYDKMNSQGVKGENITGTMQKVEETLDMVVDAYHKQLDTLFAGEALDVSSDITVMENLMQSEGLTETEGIKLTLSE